MPARTWVRQLVASALVSAAAAQSLQWTAIPYPTGDAQHQIQTAPKVKVNGKEASIGYMKFFRSGDKIGDGTAGMVGNKNTLANGGVVTEFTSTYAKDTTKPLISNNPDFSSILQVDGKLFGVTQFEAPGHIVSAYLSQYEQNAKTGAITTTNLKEVDFSSQGGVWTPCAGSVTPWQTHLGSEEYPPDAKDFYSGNGNKTSSVYRNVARYWDHYASSVNRDRVTSLGFNPYQYGYPWETVVKKDFTEKTTKLYAHGRISWEMAYVMPDNKTVYHTDDGTNCVFTMMKLKKEKDLKEGTNYCMKMTQTSPAGGDVKDFKGDIEWIEMPTPTHDEAAAAIKTHKFADLFHSENCNADGTCNTTGFKSINAGFGNGCECLKVKDGKEKLAAVFEKKRYAGYLGCTLEFYRWEGITYDADSKKAYTAMSNIGLGMDDNHAQWDLGGPNHIKVKENSCGCVMEMDIDADMKATKARMLTCGKQSTCGAAGNCPKIGNTADTCDVDFIANPDNVAIIPKAKQLIIGEDTGKHVANTIWIWDFNTTSLIRIATTSMGSETTSPYWYTIGEWSYMMFVVQHPYDVGSIHAADAADWQSLTNINPSGRAAWVGAVGPIPTMFPAATVATANAPRGATMSFSVACVLLSAVMALMTVAN